jgi:6-phosphogluconate dehydrogenase
MKTSMLMRWQHMYDSKEMDEKLDTDYQVPVTGKRHFEWKPA